MLKNEDDIKRFDVLIESLKVYSKKNNFMFKYKSYEKETNSLYRFGWFFINEYKYSVSSWNFKKNIVVFENENEKKIKYDVDNKTVYGEKFVKDTKITVLMKKIRKSLSNWLGNLSDKLQP